MYIYRAHGIGRKRAPLHKKRGSCIRPSLFRLHPPVFHIIVVFYFGTIFITLFASLVIAPMVMFSRLYIEFVLYRVCSL